MIYQNTNTSNNNKNQQMSNFLKVIDTQISNNKQLNIVNKVGVGSSRNKTLNAPVGTKKATKGHNTNNVGYENVKAGSFGGGGYID